MAISERASGVVAAYDGELEDEIPRAHIVRSGERGQKMDSQA